MRRGLSRAGRYGMLAVLGLWPTVASAVPNQLNVQGVLFDESGVPVEGATTVTVRVYDAAEAGAPLWEPAEPQDVLCEAGVFTALVPAAVAGPAADAFVAAFDAGEPRWLGIAPAGGAELTPRIPVVSVAYALVAAKAAVAEVADVAQAVDCVGCVTAGALDPAVQALFLAYDGGTSGLSATTYQAAIDELAGLVAEVAAGLAEGQASIDGLAPVARSGSYADLTGTPDLSGFAETADLGAVAFSNAYADLTGTPDVCAAVFACDDTLALLDDLLALQTEAAAARERLDETEARIWCIENCDPARLGDCRARTCDGAAETCTDAGALPDGTACAGGGQCVAGQCTNGPRCGGVLCPTLGGDADDQYLVGCNMRDHCEYANANPAGWRRWDVWIWVPPGSFLMGSPDDEGGRGSNEGPQHVVTFSRGFFIGKYEVTVIHFQGCRASGACGTPLSVDDWQGAGWGLNPQHSDDSHPQNGLTWEQAGQVCAWLVAETGGANGGLPSEAQWEYAASGPVHRKYPWGDGPEPTCEYAVYDADASGTRPWGCTSCADQADCGSCCSGTLPVGTMPAGASYVGAMDMAGNVWEWCEDWYHGNYTGAPVDGSAWEVPAGSHRVGRGGGFYRAATDLRSSWRDLGIPDIRFASIGARCVRPLPQ